MSISKYIGKIYYRCQMCDDLSFTDKYKWVGDITKQELNICAKCAQREVGKKSWQEKSQQIKKLSQK